MAPKSLVDVLAIVTSATDVEERISPKDGSTLLKRDLIILDDSNTEITLTLWGDKASDTNVNFNDSNLIVAIKGKNIHRINKQIYYMMFLSYILFIKYSLYMINKLTTLGARVANYQGCTLNTIPTTTLTYNPPEGLELLVWFEQQKTSDSIPMTTSLTVINTTRKYLNSNYTNTIRILLIKSNTNLCIIFSKPSFSYQTLDRSSRKTFHNCRNP
jgi:hypothetical protein